MSRVVASFFGAGLIVRRFGGSDHGSGTLASFFAYPLALLAGRAGVWVHIAAAGALIVASLISARPFATSEGDPNWVVIDEAAGTFVATIGLAFPANVVGWLVFRIADIQKHWFPGVAASERLPGSVGVTADDVIAGLYGLAAGWLVQAVL